MLANSNPCLTAYSFTLAKPHHTFHINCYTLSGRMPSTWPAMNSKMLTSFSSPHWTFCTGIQVRQVFVVEYFSTFFIVMCLMHCRNDWRSDWKMQMYYWQAIQRQTAIGCRLPGLWVCKKMFCRTASNLPILFFSSSEESALWWIQSGISVSTWSTGLTWRTASPSRSNSPCP